MKYLLLLLLLCGCYHERGRSYLGAEELLIDSYAIREAKASKRRQLLSTFSIGLKNGPMHEMPVSRAYPLKAAILQVVPQGKLGPLSHIKIQRKECTYLLKWKEVEALDDNSFLLLPGDVATIYLKTVRQ